MGPGSAREHSGRCSRAGRCSKLIPGPELPAGWSVRTTGPEDHDAVLRATRAAFATRGQDGEEEVRIVLETWRLDAGAPGLDLVAVEDHQVIGHVLGGIGEVSGREAIGIAPLSVVPGRQGRGIGSALMREFLTRAKTSGWPFVVLLGDPGYYGRFGFERAADYGLTYPAVGPGSEHFLVRRLRAHADMAGDFRYCWERN